MLFEESWTCLLGRRNSSDWSSLVRKDLCDSRKTLRIAFKRDAGLQFVLQIYGQVDCNTCLEVIFSPTRRNFQITHMLNGRL